MVTYIYQDSFSDCIVQAKDGTSKYETANAELLAARRLIAEEQRLLKRRN